MRLALLFLLGCQREQRELHPADTRPITSVSHQVSTYPGGAPVEGATFDPKLPGYAETAQAISDGKQLYTYYNCVGCHAHGGGSIGPPLIDTIWKYGSKPSDVAETIIAGRPMGMPSYRGKLAPQHLGALVAYVRSLGGLVRGDAVSARDEHIQLAPSPTLQHEAVPLPGKAEP
jgi:cytochrome c oxidase cbb3-type subunit 3